MPFGYKLEFSTIIRLLREDQMLHFVFLPTDFLEFLFPLAFFILQRDACFKFLWLWQCLASNEDMNFWNLVQFLVFQI
ncbi:hypothetical protein L596_001810 [Steinernema carpocapsae]|uniref:Uncharacterized protein n=1 Tax=Steinernema carpocapsae TaxID=34508 RepID=A0A4U8UM76_STECR|nr:hypothetical protein L596_001810 [Steinernema carpocapsae]